MESPRVLENGLRYFCSGRAWMMGLDVPASRFFDALPADRATFWESAGVDAIGLYDLDAGDDERELLDTKVVLAFVRQGRYVTIPINQAILDDTKLVLFVEERARGTYAAKFPEAVETT